MGGALSELYLDARALHAGRLRPPISKSDAQRALVLAYALGVPAPALGAREGLPNDVRIVAEALGRFRAAEAGLVEIDCEDGGAPLRLLVAQAALRPGAITRFVGTPRLGARPHGALFAALRRALGPAGLRIDEGSPWPLEIRGVDGAGARFLVAADESSQPVSALVLAAVAIVRRTGRACAVEHGLPLASPGYLALTLSWLERAQVRHTYAGAVITIDAIAPCAALPTVPADWSSVGYLLLAAYASGGAVERIATDTEHPDRAIVPYLASVGLELVIDDEGHTRVHGQANGGLVVRAGGSPDLVPTLAALACVLPAPSELHELTILRHKESDRLNGVVELVRAAGGTTELSGDTLRVEPPARVNAELSVDARGDHRMAMSAAVLAILAGARLRLVGGEHVKKSFPAFWDELLRIGVRLS